MYIEDTNDQVLYFDYSSNQMEQNSTQQSAIDVWHAASLNILT